MRSYARERAEGDEPAADARAATDRLYTWYAETAEAAAELLYPQIFRVPATASAARDGSPPTPAAFATLAEASAWLDAEADNLIAATLRAAADPTRRSVAWRLLSACREYLGSRGNLVDWLTAARAGLTAARADGEPRAEALANLTLARAHHSHGRVRLAMLHLSRATSLCRLADWAAGESVAVNNLGNVYCERGLLDVGSRSYHRALELAPMMPATLTNLGLANFYQGRLAEAAGRLEPAVRSYETTNSLHCASALDNLVRVRHSAGDLAGASEHIERALDLAQPSGVQNVVVALLAAQALVHCDAGRQDDALTHGRNAAELAEHYGRKLSQARALNALAVVQLAVGRHHQALATYRAGHRSAQDVDARYHLAAAALGLAQARHALGDHDQALDDASTAVELCENGGFHLLYGQALTHLAAIHRDVNEQHAATEYAEQALTIHRRTGHRLGAARTLVILGRADAANDLFTACGARPEAGARPPATASTHVTPAESHGDG